MKTLRTSLLALSAVLLACAAPIARAADIADNAYILQLTPAGDQVPTTVTFNSNLASQDLIVGSNGALTISPVIKGNLTATTLASGSATSLVTATPKTITSVTLGVGTWQVYGYVDYILASASTTLTQAGFGTTTNSFTNTLQAQDTSLTSANALTTTSGTLTSATPWLQFTVTSGTQTLYLVAEQTFSAGTVTAYGTLFSKQLK